MNKLLEKAFDSAQDLVPGSTYELGIVTIDSQGEVVFPDEAWIPPVNRFNSPFVGKSIQSLVPLIEEGSFFAVLDNFSEQDDTVCLARREGDGGLQTVRVSFNSVQTSLMALQVGSLGIEELQSIAESEGGVYDHLIGEKGVKKGKPAPRMRLGGDDSTE